MARVCRYCGKEWKKEYENERCEKSPSKKHDWTESKEKMGNKESMGNVGAKDKDYSKPDRDLSQNKEKMGNEKMGSKDKDSHSHHEHDEKHKRECRHCGKEWKKEYEDERCEKSPNKKHDWKEKNY